MAGKGANLQGWLDTVRRSFIEKGASESRALLERPDLAGVQDLMHRWAGLGGTVGQPELGDIARQIERDLAASAPEEQVRRQLQALAEAFEQARREYSK